MKKPLIFAMLIALISPKSQADIYKQQGKNKNKATQIMETRIRVCSTFTKHLKKARTVLPTELYL
jgi:hypothetical protein